MNSGKFENILLTSKGLVCVTRGSGPGSADRLLQAFDIELAELGYIVSYKLRAALATLSPQELAANLRSMRAALAEHIGHSHRHQPHFRHFPEGVPESTFEHWVSRVVAFFCQDEPGQPCLNCGGKGTTHLLSPCMHVVCDVCFDGSNFSCCPICERAVDQSSPFFKPSSLRVAGHLSNDYFKLVDLASGTVADEAKKLFESLCGRRQALSPDDLELLNCILDEFSSPVLSWLPAEIPLKENIATIFGALLKSGDSAAVLAAGRPYLKTATDVLRLIAVYSGCDAALQGTDSDSSRLAERATGERQPKKVRRFDVAKLSRSLRRSILDLLDGMPFERLVEDMLRHDSYWVWVGNFLHPFEYATRYPKAAASFAVVRETRLGSDGLARIVSDHAEEGLTISGDGTCSFQTFAAKLDAAARAGDGNSYGRILEERPGELARRIDFAIRLTLAAGQTIGPIVDSFSRRVGDMSTPVLTTLYGLLPSRLARVNAHPVRVFFPKGKAQTGVSVPETRQPLPPTVVAPLVLAVRSELVRRFADKPQFETGIVDRALDTTIVPFNERTASRSQGVNLTRGSRVRIPEGDTIRLFLHWCQPVEGERTDLDLSVGFFDTSWDMIDHVSFTQLRSHRGNGVAVHSGDRQDAPHPDGATEFVDIRREAARRAGARYAVMTANAWRGLSFDKLERVYAGVMRLQDNSGPHFDPRTVEHKFNLAGENGIFTPVLVDLETSELHWLDLYTKGQSSCNSIEASSGTLKKVLPDLLGYFGSGIRMSMFDLGLIHAASRCHNVFLREENGAVVRFTRRGSEDVIAFARRIAGGDSDGKGSSLPALTSPTFACLYRGDVVLPEGDGNVCYALFREKVSACVAASDLLS